MSRVRLEERSQARKELDNLRKELEDEYERRINSFKSREEETNRANMERERQIQLAQYETRQKLLREMDELRLREQAAAKKMELDSQGFRLLETRLQESQSFLESREREVSRRERELIEKQRDCESRAREEALAALRTDMETAHREKLNILKERDAFEEEKRAQSEVCAYLLV